MTAIHSLLAFAVSVTVAAAFIFDEVEETVDSCVTPDGFRGDCVNLLRCRQLAALLKRPISAKAKNLLRRSVCGGLKSRIPDVCCPRSGAIRETTTTEATIFFGSQPPKPITTSRTTTKPTTPTSQSTSEVTTDSLSDETTEEAEAATTAATATEEPSSPPPTTMTTTTPIATTTLPAAVNVTVAGLGECGISVRELPKVVGGREAPVSAFPWQAAIGYRDDRTGEIKYLCGGTLISRRHILTAAHCVVGDNLETVRLGEHDLASNEDSAHPEEYQVVERIMHSGYSPRSFSNDIALLALDRDVEYREDVAPICLPLLSAVVESRRFVGTTPFVAGWGATRFRGPTSNTLQYAGLQVMSNKECGRRFGDFRGVEITESKLCTFDLSLTRDACQGDSGGPLMGVVGAPGDGTGLDRARWFQIGIVSFGYKCADRFPGVYTRVSQYSGWIRDNLNEPRKNAIIL